MKYFWIFILCWLSLLRSNKLKAQKDTVHLYQIYNSFSDSEKVEWTAFENNWNYFDYEEIKKTYKLKNLNCKNCESFYADLYIEIDEDGNLLAAKFLKGKNCGVISNDELFKSKFEGSLINHRFKALKNKRFKARFGHILKC